MRKKMMFLLVLLLCTVTMQAQYLHKPGDKAIDFEGVTVDDQPYHLYESQAEWIIVCFWSAECDDCHQMLKSIRKNLDLKHDYELVTFALADDAKQVRRKTRCMRLHGYHFFDPAGWDSAPFLDYDVNITPTVILIDKDKNIVGEAYDFDELEALIHHE